MRTISLVVFFALVVGGCAASVEDSSSDQGIVSSTSASLTLEECADQRSACYAENPFFGLFTCPVQYRQCVATAEDGIPAQVVAAIADAVACREEGRMCRDAAEGPSDVVDCIRSEAQCVGSIVDIELPPIVTGTAECVDGAVDCIRAAESVGEVAACGETFQDCAVDVVVDTLPPEVGATIEDLEQCRFLRQSCVDEAVTPAALAQCAENHVACVATTLDVTLPDPPVAESLQCAEDAAACALEATSLSDLRACGADLRECAAAVVEEELTCEQQWTQCLADHPFNFFGCAAELLTCSD